MRLMNMRVTVSRISLLRGALCAATALGVVAVAGLAQARPLTAVPTVVVESSGVMLVSVDQAGAKKFIDNMAGKAIEFLGNSGMSADAKKREFDKLLRESFDMDTIGRFALGRYWRTATEAQRREYMTLFRKMVVEVYSSRFSEYNGQKFETRGVRAEGERDMLVTSFIVPPSGPEIQVDWRVRQRDGRWRVIDIIVEGVSMSVTQRSDFAAVIQRGGGDIDVLLNHLRGKG